MLTRFFGAAVLGMIALFFVGRPVLAAESFEGTVLTVGDNHHLTVKVQDDERTFVVNDQTTITLDGEGARWQDIKPGFSVTVQADAEGDHWIARAIMAYVNE